MCIVLKFLCIIKIYRKRNRERERDRHERDRERQGETDKHMGQRDMRRETH